LKTTFTIAIDGPAAAGKGTLSRRIADEYGFHHLDTGLTYRATAKALLDAGLPLDDEAVAEKIAREVELGGLDRDILSKHEIGEAASKIAVMPAVRRALVEAQQRFAQKAPGTVLDGRDIGTVVCPDADVKVYLVADAAERARRRVSDRPEIGAEALATDLRLRDERDAAQMKAAPDAREIDTTELTIDEVVDRIEGLVAARR